MNPSDKSGNSGSWPSTSGEDTNQGGRSRNSHGHHGRRQHYASDRRCADSSVPERFRSLDPDQLAQEEEASNWPSRPLESGRPNWNKGYHQRRDHNSSRHHKQGWHNRSNYQEEDPIEKEKKEHKLSLLDGVGEMFKKPSGNGDNDNQNRTVNSVYPDLNPEMDQHLAEKSKELERNDSTTYKGERQKFSHRGKSRYDYNRDGYHQNPYPPETDQGPSYNKYQNDSHHNRHQKQWQHKPYWERQDGDMGSGGRGHRYQRNVPSAPPAEGDQGWGGNQHRQFEKQQYGDTRQGFRNRNKNERRDEEQENIPDERHHGKSHRHKFAPPVKQALDDDATQRETLTDQLQTGEFECIVCCEVVRHKDPVWSCSKCYNLFHFHCIRKWARTPTAIVEDQGWRCPTCQDIYHTIPHSYLCFCGKVQNPEMNRHDTPHSCGNVCGRLRQDKNCSHHCNLLCHPGPCPPCSTFVSKNCECGKVEMKIRCGRSTHLTCDGTCDKVLNCGKHKCKKQCHGEECLPCSVQVKQDCHCTRTSREVPCTKESSNSSVFVCDEICDKLLSCQVHKCSEVCHQAPCPPCKDSPDVVTNCPCGKSSVKELLEKSRLKCTEPIPTCAKPCQKVLLCGPPDDPHICYSKCHLGECPPCPLKSTVNCRCGSLSKDYKCSELDTVAPFFCKKRCNQKKQCNRHKCVSTCCIEWDHICNLTCNRKLTCGLHQCPEPCHKGNCKTCSNVSFEDLTCHCGGEVIVAPVACGTKPPECNRTCTRQHACNHPIRHSCHSDEECPPCTALTEKWCFGGHEKRKNVVCHISTLSCGLPCQKPLSCQLHKCPKICHLGECEGETESGLCLQRCTRKRVDCEHSCSAPCHQGPCPMVPCKSKIKISCECGNLSEDVPCSENVKLFKQVSASLLASKMQDIQLGNSVDISDVLSASSCGAKKNKYGRLDCNDQCTALERNKRIALALQIRNPDLSTNPGPPKYSDFLKDEAKKNSVVVKSCHDKLTELVHLAKQSKQKSRSHSFPPMNREQRRIIHELAEFFGCETESFDQEPKRNVVVTAFKDRSFLPSISVMALIQREMGMRKIPQPVPTSLSRPLPPNLVTNGNVLRAGTDSLALSTAPSATGGEEKVIDYFDY